MAAGESIQSPCWTQATNIVLHVNTAPPSPCGTLECHQHPRSQFLLPVSPLCDVEPHGSVSVSTCATAPEIKASNSGGLFQPVWWLRHSSVLSRSLVVRLAAERPREGRQKKRKLTHSNTDALPSSTKLQMAFISRR